MRSPVVWCAGFNRKNDVNWVYFSKLNDILIFANIRQGGPTNMRRLATAGFVLN